MWRRESRGCGCIANGRGLRLASFSPLPLFSLSIMSLLLVGPTLSPYPTRPPLVVNILDERSPATPATSRDSEPNRPTDRHDGVDRGDSRAVVQPEAQRRQKAPPTVLLPAARSRRLPTITAGLEPAPLRTTRHHPLCPSRRRPQLRRARSGLGRLLPPARLQPPARRRQRLPSAGRPPSTPPGSAAACM